jgi:transcriptional regulator with XRE-family HTH domain
LGPQVYRRGLSGLRRNTLAPYHRHGGRAHRQGDQPLGGAALPRARPRSANRVRYRALRPRADPHVCERSGQRIRAAEIAKASNTSLSVVSAILRGKRRPTLATLTKLYRALSRLERVALAEAELTREVLEAVKRRCRLIGVRWLAKRAGVDAANLAKALSGRREPSRAMLAKLEAALRLRT